MDELCKEKFDTIIGNLVEIKTIVKDLDTKHNKLNSEFLSRINKVETMNKVFWWFITLLGGAIVSIFTGLVKL